MKASKGMFAAIVTLGALWSGALAAQPPGFPLPGAPAPALSACFLLFDINGGQVRRSPAQACSRRVAPGATFDVVANLVGLDAGVMPGSAVTRDARKQEAALGFGRADTPGDTVERLSTARMGEYLSRLNYGNADTGSGGEYWNGGSLEISPDEQMHFLSRLYRDELPVSRQAMSEARSSLGQPPEVLIGRYGATAIVRLPRNGDTASLGKSASLVVGNEAIRWQIGQIERGSRRFVFVSCVTGPLNLPDNAATLLAAQELRNGGAL